VERNVLEEVLCAAKHLWAQVHLRVPETRKLWRLGCGRTLQRSRRQVDVAIVYQRVIHGCVV
jgi:hypothetical protein